MIRHVSFYLFVLFNLLFSMGAFAQTEFNYFNDSLRYGVGWMENCVEYNGYFITAGKNQLTSQSYDKQVACFDTLGKVLWSTAQSDTVREEHEFAVYDMFLGSDSFLYVSWYITNTYAIEQWKVNPKTGDRLWVLRFNNTRYSGLDNLIDFDSSHLLLAFTQMPGGNSPNIYRTHLTLVNKATGDTSSTIKLTSYRDNPKMALGVDESKHIYYSFGDTLNKLTALNPDSLKWRNIYTTNVIPQFSFIGFDNARGRVVGFGKRLIFIDKNSGTTDTILSPTFGSSPLGFEVRDSFLYVNYPGSGAVSLFKFSLNTMSEKWYFQYSFAGGGNQYLNSYAFDDSSNIYATGIFRTIGNWGIVKINDSTGTLIWSNVVTNNPGSFTIGNHGLYAKYLNGKPYFLGDLQKDITQPNSGYGPFEQALVKANSSDGSLIMKATLRLHHQDPSAAISILNYPTNKTLVYKQVGRHVELEMLDSLQNRVWARQFKNDLDWYIIGRQMNIAPNGDIGITAFTAPEDGIYPFYKERYDSILYWRINASGNVKKRGALNRLKFAMPEELHMDNNWAYIGYSEEGKHNFRLELGSNWTGHVPTNIEIPQNEFGSHHYFNHSDSFFYLVGQVGTSSKIYKYNKFTGLSIWTANLPAELGAIHSVVKTSPTSLVLAGSKASIKSTYAMYDLTSSDTLWSSFESGNTPSKCHRMVLNEDGNYIYSLNRLAGGLEIIKIEVTSGKKLWSHFKMMPNGESIEPSSIAFDKYRNQICITAVLSTSLGSSATFLVLDSNGNKRQDYKFDGQVSGYNKALCVEILYDSSRWFGGQFNSNALGKVGYYGEVRATNYYSNDTVRICDSMLSPSGKFTWKEPGFYRDTITLSNTSDSIFVIHLLLSRDTVKSQVSSCGPFYSASGKYVWQSSGTYYDTLINSYGCDSFVQIELTIYLADSSSISLTTCDSMPSFGGNQIWNTSGVYRDTLQTVFGCDSIVTVNLTINSSKSYVDSIHACDSFTWIDGITYSASTSTPVFILKSSTGCDSIVKLVLSIESSPYLKEQVSTCSSYTWKDGKTYTVSTSGVLHVVPVSGSCDSVYELDLTITPINLSITQKDYTLKATSGASAYQWFTCANGSFTAIQGATQDTIVVSQNGNYAVSITMNNCTDTSKCIAVTGIGWEESNLFSGIRIFPNPSNGVLHIQFDEPQGQVKVKLIDAQGKQVAQLHGSGTQIDWYLETAPGMYWLQIDTPQGTYRTKLSRVR